jgi:hypothetical protein
MLSLLKYRVLSVRVYRSTRIRGGLLRENVYTSPLFGGLPESASGPSRSILDRASEARSMLRHAIITCPPFAASAFVVS